MLDLQNVLRDQSIGELCRRGNWSSLQSVSSEKAVVAKHGLAKGGRKEDVVGSYAGSFINVQIVIQQCKTTIR